MCGGRATLPGVVSLYSAAYLCSAESAFDNTYLYGFTTMSADGTNEMFADDGMVSRSVEGC